MIFLQLLLAFYTLWCGQIVLAALPLEVKDMEGCGKDTEVCRVTWVLDRELTMMLYGHNATGYPVFYNETEGVFQKRVSQHTEDGSCDDIKEVTKEEMEDINFGLGIQKFVYTINGEIPGPTLVLYKNQTVEIEVINNIPHESTSIHWHGMVQQGTPFMDGVGMVSQCPINSGETFVYRFNADSIGTRWYHSHIGVQRGDGLYGAIVVKDEEGDKERGWEFDNDFVMLVQDWVQETGVYDLYHSTWGLTKYLKNGIDEEDCGERTVSRVINGRGYLYKDDTDQPIVPVPLTRYIVEANKRYRFRIINTGLDEPLKVHVDQHKMTVIATDGSPLKNFTTDYVGLHTGERYDVIIETNQEPGLYWIRAEHIEHPDHPGLAILEYVEPGQSATEDLPNSNSTNCTEQKKCRVSNCPFQNYLTSSNKPSQGKTLECWNVENMEVHPTMEEHEEVAEEDIEEHFIAFQFTVNPRDSSQPSANGIHFVVPSKPPMINREIEFDRPCDHSECANGPCECSYIMKVKANKTIQITFAGADGFFGHPIHLHGHDFQVIKMEYSEPDATPPDAYPSGLHSHIDCSNQTSQAYVRCTNPTWSNKTWTSTSLPGANTLNPPLKDTISVPRRAYAVVRFKSNNPGFWMLHCHIDFHFAHGMGLIVQEGDLEEMPEAHQGMPTCGSFAPPPLPSASTSTVQTPAAGPTEPDDKPDDTSTPEAEASQTVEERARHIMGYIGCVIGGLFVGALTVYCYFKCKEVRKQERQVARAPPPEQMQEARF